VKALETAHAKAVAMADGKDKAFFYYDVVMDAMENLRKPVDALETMVDQDIWPVPTYADLIFEV